jgi:hypothetical protein
VKSFAGFWRDGAVVQPGWEQCEKRHFVGIFKDSEQYALISRSFSQWHQVYWLDTTTPTELSPQEALECYKTIWPFAERINKTHGGYYVDFGNGKPIINWGNVTEYPSKQKWRVPTDADKGKKCRCWDIGEPVLEGVFVSTHDDRFVVLIDDEYLAWDCCEVQDEA